MKPYPIFLIGLADRHCIVIGGRHEAERKVKELLHCEATVTVICPTLTAQLQVWADEGRFTWLKRPYQPGDLRGAFLVMAQRVDAETNGRIWAEAEAEKALVSVMDDVTHSNYIAGSVMRQGRLVISVSTSGAAPALSARLRQQLQAEFGPEYATFLEWMEELRRPMMSQVSSFPERRRRWYELIDSDILTLIRDGRFQQAQKRIAEISQIV